MNNPYQAPSADLHTSANESPLQYVGFWARVAAYIVDSILLMLVMYPLLYLVIGDIFTDPAAAESFNLPISYWLISIGLPILFFVGFWIVKNTTPGKMLFSATIVDAKTGGTPSKGQYIGRYLGYIVSSIPLGLGFLWAAWDKRKQTWHDKMAGTVVVKPSTEPAKYASFNQQ